MKNSHRFFINTACRYYPCHSGCGELNCLFCYCPLYPFPDCGGNYTLTEKGIKVCTDCAQPHIPANYEYIVTFLKKKLSG